jgi:hypothetical protein
VARSNDSIADVRARSLLMAAMASHRLQHFLLLPLALCPCRLRLVNGFTLTTCTAYRNHSLTRIHSVFDSVSLFDFFEYDDRADPVQKNLSINSFKPVGGF